MKNHCPQDEIKLLKDRREYWTAAWRLIDKTLFREDAEVLNDLKTEVGAILKEAIAKNIFPEAHKIVRDFKKYLHKDDIDEAQLELNGVTIPEMIEEIDERALLL